MTIHEPFTGEIGPSMAEFSDDYMTYVESHLDDDLREIRSSATYLALVEGDFDTGADPERVITGPVPGLKTKSSSPVTSVRRIASANGLTLLRVRARPDAPGQIRAHLASAGHPVVGDTEHGLAITSGDTVSVGVGSFPQDGRTSPDIMDRTDEALYRAKANGRNCIALFDESMQTSVTQRMDMENALYGAVDRRELRLYHQPIVDISTGRVSGFEALILWQRSDG